MTSEQTAVEPRARVVEVVDADPEPSKSGAVEEVESSEQSKIQQRFISRHMQR